MRTASASPILFVLFLLLAAAVATASGATEPVWEHVTVRIVDDAPIEDVTLRWGLNGFSLRVTDAAGETRGVSPSRVAAVLDAAGGDITQVVADACPADGITFAVLGAERVVPLNFRWMLDAGVTGNVLHGDADFLKDGALFAGLRRRLCSWSHLHLLYRRQVVVEDMEGLRGIADTHSDEVHLLIGSRMTHPRRNDNLVYLEIGPSLLRYAERWKDGALRSNEDWVLAGTLRAGAVYPVGDRIGLDAGMIFMLRPGVVDGNGVAESMFGVDLGLTARW